MNLIVSNNLDALNKLCVKHNVEELHLFGSALSKDFNEHSDLDFAVIFKAGLTPIEHGESFLNLLSGLKELLNREIDLISYRVVKNPIFKEELDRTKVRVYAAA
jgi:predicted nucleotidyltransferase